jgi:Ion channel
MERNAIKRIAKRMMDYVDKRPGLTLAVILALAQCFIWLCFFFVWVKPATPGVVLIVLPITGSIVAVGALFLHNKMVGDYNLRLAVISLINILVLTVLLFGYLYWDFGTRANFNTTLSHVDAIYFALGTLTTAGTGSIEATSETARTIQGAQMAIDVALVLFAAGLIVGRASSTSGKRRLPVPARPPREFIESSRSPSIGARVLPWVQAVRTCLHWFAGCGTRRRGGPRAWRAGSGHLEAVRVRLATPFTEGLCVGVRAAPTKRLGLDAPDMAETIDHRGYGPASSE